MSQMVDKNQIIIVREDGRIRVQSNCIVEDGENQHPTQQQFKDECDVNVIVSRFQKQGIPLPDPKGFYADFVGMPDYREMLHNVKSAQDSFMKLAPEIRRRFDNDPAKLLSFLNDPKNLKEASDLGLVDMPVKASGNDDSNDDMQPTPASKSTKKGSASKDSAGSAGE